MTSYIVTCPLATPYREDGTREYLYEGADVPSGLREGEVERMVELGYFGEASAASAPEKTDAKPARKTAAK